MEDIEMFSEMEFDVIYKVLKHCTIEDAFSSKLPKATILGGQPGAGKSSLITRLKMEKDNNIIVISGDDFRKEHPHFDKLYAKYGDAYVNHTQKFSSQVTERLIDELSKEKYNLIIEGTLRTAAVPINTARLLKSRGYHVELAVMAVPPILSYVGTIERYEKMKEIGTTPRMTTKQQHDNTVHAIVESIEKVYQTGVFDDIYLQNRQSECLYRMTETPAIAPETVLQREHNRNITPEESSYLDKVVEYIENRRNIQPDNSADSLMILNDMHIQVAAAKFQEALKENGFHSTLDALSNLTELVKSTGKIWRLEDVAQEYKTGENVNKYIAAIGKELENQQLEMIEIQPEI